MNEDQFVVRFATPADRQDVLDIQPTAHHGIDYLDHYYLKYLNYPEYFSTVSCCADSGRIVSYMYSYVISQRTVICFGGGRTVDEYKRKGLSSKMTKFLVYHLLSKGYPIQYSAGVFSLPSYNKPFLKRYFTNRSYQLYCQQVGFELTCEQMSGMLSKRDTNWSSTSRKIDSVEQLVHLLFNEIQTGNLLQLFPPMQVVVLRREPLFITADNLRLFHHHLRYVVVSRSEDSDPIWLTAVSWMNWYYLRDGSTVHAVIDYYSSTEEYVVPHLLSHFETLVATLPLTANRKIYISLFFPEKCFYNEVLNLIRMDPSLLNISLSNNPKLNCDLRVGVAVMLDANQKSKL